MTDTTAQSSVMPSEKRQSQSVGNKKPSAAMMARHMRARRRAERRFRWMGIVAVSGALGFLLFLLISIFSGGWSAFLATEIRLDIHLETKKDGMPDYRRAIREALMTKFPDIQSRKDIMSVSKLVSKAAPRELALRVADDPDLIGQTQSFWLPASSVVDIFTKGGFTQGDLKGDHLLSEHQRAWLATLSADEDMRLVFNSRFLTSGDSREPELAGIWGAIVGSFFTIMVTLLLSFPIGVTAAIYLEELAPRNRFTDLIEININNLAAVPSIVFGLLGLAIFLNFMDLPRSAPLVGGMVLALMTLPTIIIATRASLKAVPPSIREAAFGMGASPLQVVGHHVLPLAMPGILTGTIVGLSQALGETAPLLMIGMVAFIVDIPATPMDPSTVLPVQIFLWADSPERGFIEKVGGATMVLLMFLVVMNSLAIYLRKKFERRW